MLTGAFSILSVAALLGVLLAALVLRPNAGAPPRLLGWVHGGLGAGGLALLLPSLGGPPRGVTQGTDMFGVDAAMLLGAALLAGLLRRRQPGLVLVLHAVFAMFGYVILAAYVSAG